jgi:hypothetical protein
MKHTIALRTGVVFLLLALTFWTTLVPAFAHGDEDEDADHATSHVESVDTAKLEQMITLLNQLILLINALHIQQGYAPVATVPAVTDDHAEMDEHHDEHSHETTVNPAVAQFKIEVEPHDGKTHVHVRWLDKPEEMFFIETDLHDTAGIIAAVKTKTGLTDDVIREALEYME